MEQNDELYNPYEIHCLDTYGKIKRKYVFVGDSIENFSNDESIETIVVRQQIHPDDSIRVIKNKIIHAIGENNVSYNELFMYVTVEKHIQILELYQKSTQKDRIEFTREHVIQLLKNMRYDNAIIESITTSEKTHYFYDDLIEYIDPNQNILNISLGRTFAKQYEPMFSANPYDYYPGVFTPSPKNPLIVSDNLLLLNYGNPLDNTIFLCFAEDVLEHAIQNNQNEATITQTYFPLLMEEDEITSKAMLFEKKQQVINRSKSRIKPDAFVLYKSIDFFYDVFRKRKSDLAYSERGIVYYSVLLKNNIQAKLPLEIIFKNIHATKSVPFIKYNPGQMRENVYRLYSEKISRNGKKIPFLSETAIMQLSRKIGKKNQISMYTESETIVDFESNGNIRIYGELKKPMLPSEISDIIFASVNPIIENINDFLNKSGYFIKPFRNIYDSDHVEVLDMKYVASMVVDNEVALQKYIKCLYGIFTIYDAKIVNPARLAYKRVQNFQEMDAEIIYIKQIYKSTEDVQVILNAIMEQFQVSSAAAQKTFAKYLENKDSFSGQNPGFQTIIRSDPLENKIIVEVANIIHIEYVRILHMYIDSLFRITQKPESTGVSKETINEICKNADKISKDADKSHLPVIMPAPQLVEEDEVQKLFQIEREEPVEEPVEEPQEEEGDEAEDRADIIDALEQDILEDDALFYEDDEEGDDLF
jgi:hypothetical protein